MLYEELTDRIIGAALEVHKILGPGFLEYVYQKALCHELKLRGIALTKEAMLTGNSWHLYDGSAGIRGEVIKADEMEQLLAYAADFVSTFTGNLVQEEVTITDWGQTSSSSGSVQDAVNEGISSAVRKYADKLMEEVNQNGYFVRCAGGTQFYIYIQEVIDMEDAEIAGSRIKNTRRQ